MSRRDRCVPYGGDIVVHILFYSDQQSSFLHTVDNGLVESSTTVLKADCTLRIKGGDGCGLLFLFCTHNNNVVKIGEHQRQLRVKHQLWGFLVSERVYGAPFLSASAYVSFASAQFGRARRKAPTSLVCTELLL